MAAPQQRTDCKLITEVNQTTASSRYIISHLPTRMPKLHSNQPRGRYTDTKLGRPRPLASLRSALTSHKFLTNDPLRVYALASHFGFRPETQLASTRTLSSNIFSLESFDILSTMPASATLPLLRLHRARRDALRTLFDSPERFLAGNGQPFHCSSCAITPLENSSWRALKHRVLRELDVCSSGAAMQDYGIAVSGGLWGEDGMGNWPEAKACWAAMCVKPGCGATNYDRVATIRQMRACP
ncbi:hypothetical protein R3P38DRAFT_2986491 [Favolaschia claudopus]|uniref:Uncharacterized protein n=1 Tax=Favolaschia claudopus TaxID=2862362 RepID=A0AAW0AVV3_9AGAR